MPEDYSNSSGGVGSRLEAQAKYQLEQARDNSINSLAGLTTVQEKDGKQYLLGMEVPAELAGTLQYITSIAPTIVSDFLREGVYKHSSGIFNTLNEKLGRSPNLNAGHKVGLTSAAAVSALLVGMQPISETVHAVRQRSRDRRQIREVLSAIVETDKAAYKDNEVIKTAMEKINKTMVTGFKQAAAELPTVLLNGHYAIESHKELVKTFERENKYPRATVDGGIFDAAKERIVLNRENEDKRKIFFAEQKKNKYSEEEIKTAWQEELENAQKIRDYPEDRQPLKQTETAGKMVLLTGVGGLNVLLKQLVAKSASANEKTTAYELITDLQEKVNSGNLSDSSGITEKVIGIFQQNEIDRGRSGIGPALMEKFNPLAERMAEVIANRELDPLALVSLVGDGKVVNKRRFIKMEQLEELIDAQRKIFGSHEKTPLDELLADFQKPKMIMAAIVETLQTLKGSEKAIFASLFSDDVLLHAGIKKKEIPALRTEGHSGMVEFAKSYTIELAKKTPEELKAKGLSEKQIESIKNLNELIVAGNDKEIKSTIGRGSEVIGALRNAMLQEQIESNVDGKTYWTKIIKQKPQFVAEKPQDTSLAETVKAGRENNVPVGGIA